jgi:hypothetical protein
VIKIELAARHDAHLRGTTILGRLVREDGRVFQGTRAVSDTLIVMARDPDALSLAETKLLVNALLDEAFAK